MRWKRGFLVLGSMALVSSVALAGEVMVHVGHNKLDPAEITIAAGTTVVFHNLDQMPGGHSVVADDGSFHSPGLAKDQSWSHTFDEPGIYTYSIKEHPAARGRIVVE
jgi:plastocyanin